MQSCPAIVMFEHIN